MAHMENVEQNAYACWHDGANGSAIIRTNRACVKNLKRKLHSKRLTEFRNKLNMSQADLADTLGIAQRTYAAYETGRFPPLKVLEGLAGLGLDTHWLVTGSREMMVISNSPLSMIADAPSPYALKELLNAEDVMVPIYEGPVSAGLGASGSDVIVGYGQFLRDWLRREAGVDPGRAFIVPVHGHSMMKLLYDGDLVLGERVEYLDRDGIFAVLYYGEVLIKHVVRGHKEVRLISENPAFETISITEGERDHSAFKVIGRIVRKLTRL